MNSSHLPSFRLDSFFHSEFTAKPYIVSTFKETETKADGNNTIIFSLIVYLPGHLHCCFLAWVISHGSFCFEETLMSVSELQEEQGSQSYLVVLHLYKSIHRSVVCQWCKITTTVRKPVLLWFPCTVSSSTQIAFDVAKFNCLLGCLLKSRYLCTSYWKSVYVCMCVIYMFFKVSFNFILFSK